MEININAMQIQLIQGDITEQDTDAIVNAANSKLAHGGGVARAIASIAGQELVRASEDAPEVPTGEVYTTPAGNLKAKKVIHAVGPLWYGGKKNEEELLENTIKNSLKEANELGLRSISFPAISTGIYGYPLQQAAEIILSTIRSFIVEEEQQLYTMRIVLFQQEDFDVFQHVAKDVFQEELDE